MDFPAPRPNGVPVTGWGRPDRTHRSLLNHWWFCIDHIGIAPGHVPPHCGNAPMPNGVPARLGVLGSDTSITFKSSDIPYRPHRHSARTRTTACWISSPRTQTAGQAGRTWIGHIDHFQIIRTHYRPHRRSARTHTPSLWNGSPMPKLPPELGALGSDTSITFKSSESNYRPHRRSARTHTRMTGACPDAKLPARLGRARIGHIDHFQIIRRLSRPHRRSVRTQKHHLQFARQTNCQLSPDFPASAAGCRY